MRLLELENSELISCSADKTIKIWDLNTGICIKTLAEHKDYAMSIIENKQNNTLISCSLDGTIKTCALTLSQAVHI